MILRLKKDGRSDQKCKKINKFGWKEVTNQTLHDACAKNILTSLCNTGLLKCERRKMLLRVLLKLFQKNSDCVLKAQKDKFLISRCIGGSFCCYEHSTCSTGMAAIQPILDEFGEETCPQRAYMETDLQGSVCCPKPISYTLSWLSDQVDELLPVGFVHATGYFPLSTKSCSNHDDCSPDEYCEAAANEFNTANRFFDNSDSDGNPLQFCYKLLTPWGQVQRQRNLGLQSCHSFEDCKDSSYCYKSTGRSRRPTLLGDGVCFKANCSLWNKTSPADTTVNDVQCKENSECLKSGPFRDQKSAPLENFYLRKCVNVGTFKSRTLNLCCYDKLDEDICKEDQIIELTSDGSDFLKCLDPPEKEGKKVDPVEVRLEKRKKITIVLLIGVGIFLAAALISLILLLFFMKEPKNRKKKKVKKKVSPPPEVKIPVKEKSQDF
ncbi:unnamed protein product [Caenorhabditis auriculariae]|uniref:Domain of unknown function DX domain-containing protein n=1 Tax=Caenorhabditis auriculariae TaxID=2777116 RepID=A0A8S1HPZ9_9PELO|nr:unnamed protein product [Caenorhabditis auriculariae]